MAAETKISWAHSTFNRWIGCTKVSAACDGCYAEREWAGRKHRVKWGPHGDRSPTKTLPSVYQWQRAHEAFYALHGERRRVFVNSLSDFGDNHRSIEQSWRDDVHQAWRDCPDLDFLILTKRPQNLAKPGFLPPDWSAERYPNVWLGTTVEHPEAAAQRLDHLVSLDARVRFLSMEPLLDGVALRPWIDRIHWVLVGGESGPRARSMDLAWARSLKAQCRAAGVLFHMKQLSQADHPSTFKSFETFPADLQVREVPLAA